MKKFITFHLLSHIVVGVLGMSLAYGGPLQFNSLVESGGWQAELQVDCFSPGVQCGHFRFGATGCQGTLTYIGERNQGYVFKQNLAAGRCEPNCELWLSSDLDSYQEFCRGGLSGQGKLSIKSNSDIQPSVATPPPTIKPSAPPSGVQPATTPVAMPPPRARDNVIRTDDVIYRGNFTIDEKSGLVNGAGRVEWHNGNLYEGAVLRSTITGQGTFRWTNGDRYEGEMRNAEPDGHGSYFYRNGDHYVGMWRNGLKHGTGRYTYTDGSYWEGKFENDRQAQGSLTWSTNGETVSASVYQARQVPMPATDKDEGIAPELKPQPARKPLPNTHAKPAVTFQKAEPVTPAAPAKETVALPQTESASANTCGDASPIFCRAREQQRR